MTATRLSTIVLLKNANRMLGLIGPSDTLACRISIFSCIAAHSLPQLGRREQQNVEVRHVDNVREVGLHASVVLKNATSCGPQQTRGPLQSFVRFTTSKYNLMYRVNNAMQIKSKSNSYIFIPYF